MEHFSSTPGATHHNARQEKGGKGSRDKPAVSNRKETRGDQGSVAWQASRQRALSSVMLSLSLSMSRDPESAKRNSGEHL